MKNVEKCCIDDCELDIFNIKNKLCRKHYMRLRRYGNVESRVRKRKDFIYSTQGKVLIYKPEHPLSFKNGYIFEHKLVLSDKYGEHLPPCCSCGSKVNWNNIKIFHIDGDFKNNSVSNLRILCMSCLLLQVRERKNPVILTCDGVTKTIKEWSDTDGVSCTSYAGIVYRLNKGYCNSSVLFSEKLTHKYLVRKNKKSNLNIEVNHEHETN